MPRSMRQQTAVSKKRKKSRSEISASKKRAYDILSNGGSVRVAAKQTDLGVATVGRLSAAINKNEIEKVKLLLSPTKCHQGRRRHFTDDEEHYLADYVILASKRGFAVTTEQLRVVAGELASKLGKPFKNEIPSKDWVNTFRSEHRDLTVRKCERVYIAKYDAGHPNHVKTYERVLKKLNEDHPGIFKDPRFLLNMDETAVTVNDGQMEKAFSPADSRYGGTRLHSNAGSNKHVTAVVITTAAGHTLPPFFIFAGKYRVSDWFLPLNPEVFKDKDGPHWLTREDWFPKTTFLTGTQNGSMEMSVIENVIAHIQKHYRHIVPPRKKLCLLLDGHSSRNGIKWLQAAREANIEVVQAPSNTSHFLQPNDDAVNRVFKKAVRGTQLFLLSKKLLSFNNVAMKLRLGMAGFRAITEQTVKRAWLNTGLWPMDYRFVAKAEQNWNGAPLRRGRGAPKGERAETALKRFEEIINSRRRTQHPKQTFLELSHIIQSQTPREVLGSYLEKGSSLTKGQAEKNTTKPHSKTILRHGGPALYMTHGEFIAARKDHFKRKVDEQARKEAAKAERALKRQKKADDKLKKKLEREKKKAQKNQKPLHQTQSLSAESQEELIQFLSFSDEEEEEGTEQCAEALLFLNQARSAADQMNAEHVVNQSSIVPEKPPEVRNEAGVAQGVWELTVDESVDNQACLNDPKYTPYRWVLNNAGVPH